MNTSSLVDFDKLDDETQQLIRESVKARSFAYTPYSTFKVGAALLCQDGVVRTGCNVENASFGATLCAERCVLGKAVSEGQRNYLAISIAAEKIEGRLTTPCGICRQMLSEFGDFPVYVTCPMMHQVLVTSTQELLPYAFRKGSGTHPFRSNSTI